MPVIHLEAIRRESKQPIYRQIIEQIQIQIGDGRLPRGAQLPTVRALADQLGVTRLTVQNAYRDLQSDGWIESTVGRGTYVKALVDRQALMESIGRQSTPDQVMRDMLRVSGVAGVRSLSHAEPDPAFYPTVDFMRFFTQPGSVDSSLMQYGPQQGDEALRTELSRLLTIRSIEAAPEDILITAGVSQGLSLLTAVLARPGDTAAVEQPVYLGMLNVLGAHGVTAVGIPMDREGIQIEPLERMIVDRRPRFLYTIPCFQNPTGLQLSETRARELIALAERHNLLIVEDDIYGLLAYDGTAPLPLKAFDRSGRVIHAGSFSKTLMPGLRIGYLVLPAGLRERLILQRQAQDLSSPLILQRALAFYLHRGRFKAHLDRIIPQYRARRDALLGALERWMPDGVTWTHPAGGFCCWLTLPSGAIPSDFQQIALQSGVAYTPGDAFLPTPDGSAHMRLCFSQLLPELIEEAIATLGTLIEQANGPGAGRLRTLNAARPLV